MKVISKADLCYILPHITNESFSLREFEKLLEAFGDDYFIVDGEFVKTKENELMKTYRDAKF